MVTFFLCGRRQRTGFFPPFLIFSNTSPSFFFFPESRKFNHHFLPTESKAISKDYFFFKLFCGLRICLFCPRHDYSLSVKVPLLPPSFFLILGGLARGGTDRRRLFAGVAFGPGNGASNRARRGGGRRRWCRRDKEGRGRGEAREGYNIFWLRLPVLCSSAPSFLPPPLSLLVPIWNPGCWAPSSFRLWTFVCEKQRGFSTFTIVSAPLNIVE